jgi:hypothetical protein
VKNNLKNMNMFLKKLVFPLMGFALFVFASNDVFAARFFLSPSTSELYSGCESAVNIMIDTEGAESTAADAIIDYNPAEIEIVDQNLSVPGIQVRTGTVYEFYPGNKAESGRIYLTGGSIMSNYKTGGSPEIYGSIILKNKPGVVSSSLNFYYLGSSTVDSNISDPSGAVDLLNSVAGASFTFVDRGYCGSDIIAPVVSNVKPLPNSKGNPLNSNISFDISDNLSGVKLSSVRVNIDGVDYVSGGAGFSSPGDKMKYSITIDPTVDFLVDTQVRVTIYAEDNAGNGMIPYVFTFNEPILDEVGPYVVNALPTNGSTGNPLESNITFYIEDDMSGVDRSTLVVRIDGKEYIDTDSSVIITGPVTNFFVTVNPDDDFLPDTKVEVEIDAEDLKGNPMKTFKYSFNQPVADTQPPYVVNAKPTNGSRKVPLNSNVSFNIRDNVSGVDIDTVSVEIEGEIYMKDDFFQLTGSKADYSIVIDPVSDFPEGKEITVKVNGKDFRGNAINPPYVYKFNRPAVCGDKLVEEDFGEQCELPGTPGCDENCQWAACTIPEIPACGNRIVEEGEACEPPGVGLCALDCSLSSLPVETPLTEVFDPVETVNMYTGFLGVDTEQQEILREMVKDSDNDGLPDQVEILKGTNPNSVDSDNDGVNDMEELLDYGTNPNVFDAEFLSKLKIVSPEDKSKTGNGRLFVRGISEELRNVKVTATSLIGEKFDLGTVLASDNGKFALASETVLEPGEYLLIAENFNDDGSVYDTSDAVEVFIDPMLAIPAPKVRSINNIEVKLGEIPRVPDFQPMVAGTADSGSQVVSVFESSIFSSTIVSDAASGFFTVFAPRPLELGDHKVTVYSVSADGVISEANTVNFEVIEKVSMIKSFPWWFWIIWILLLILLIVIGYLYYKKRKKQEEIDYMKKLVAPVFEQKVESEIKKELGDKAEKSDDLFQR